MSDWHLIGPHRFRHQDEVLYFEPHGTLTETHATVWLEIVATHFQRAKHNVMMVDARDLKPPSPEVRKMFLSLVKERKIRPYAIGFGINLIIRAASRLVMAAARQLYGLEIDVVQFATEAESWTHVDQLRRKRKAEAAAAVPPPP